MLPAMIAVITILTAASQVLLSSGYHAYLPHFGLTLPPSLPTTLWLIYWALLQRLLMLL